MKNLIPLILCFLTPGFLWAQAGTIDSLWGTDGHIYQDVLSGDDEINDAVAMPDGKIVVCGTARRTALNTQLLVARFMPDGSLDNSFGNGGFYHADFPVQTAANAIGLKEDGTIFVVGRYGTSADPQMFVMKLKPNGSLDSTFNFVGYDQVTFGANTNGEAFAIYMYPGLTSPILIAGQVDDGTDPDMAVVKLFPNGNPDVTFGTNAARIIDFRAADVALDITVSDALVGDIVVVGSSVENNSSDVDMALARLNSDGSNENAFSNDGRAFVNIGSGSSIAYSVDVTGTGLTVVGGYGFDSATGGQAKAIAVLELDGSLYTNFNGTGIKTLSTGVNDFLVGRSVEILPNGRILIAGTGGPFGSYDFCIYGLNLQGQLDNSFGTNGMTQVGLGSGSNNSCNKVMMLPNKKILLLGSAFNQGSFDLTMLRLNNDLSNSIADFSEPEQIKIFPNPVYGSEVNFEIEIKNEGIVQVFNSLGELVAEKQLLSGLKHSIELDDQLSSGNYFIQIMEEGMVRARGQIQLLSD